VTYCGNSYVYVRRICQIYVDAFVMPSHLSSAAAATTGRGAELQAAANKRQLPSVRLQDLKKLHVIGQGKAKAEHVLFAKPDVLFHSCKAVGLYNY